MQDTAENKIDNNTEVTQNETVKDTAPQPKHHKSKAKEYFDALLFAALVAFFLKIFFVEAYRIPTGSMENTLLVGDFLLVNKFVYGATTPRNIPFTDIRIPFFRLPALQNPERGDVVVFDYPGNRDEAQPKDVLNFIKRMVALPGDTVLIKDKVLYINGQEFPNPPNSIVTGLPQKTIETRTFPKGTGWNEDNYGPLAVPKKGDTLKLNADNYEAWKIFIIREGHIPRLTSDNKVFIDEKPVTDYIVEKNYYFMMGDNRGNSSDSRYWGFMPAESIVGEAVLIYWSWDPNIPFSQIGNLLSSIRWNRIAKIIH